MTLRREALALALLPFLLAPVLAGCDSVEPVTRADVVGSYEATTLSVTADGETTDQLAAGAEITLQLADDGTTSGALFVPGGAEDGGDLEADLAGNWSFQAMMEEPSVPARVTLDHDADTFLRDVTFDAVRGGGTIQLRAEDSFGGVTIEVELSRQ